MQQEYREYMTYLDKLRDSGETNMYGARPYLERRFGMTEEEATKVLGHWMNTFASRHPEAAQERKERMRQ